MRAYVCACVRMLVCVRLHKVIIFILFDSKNNVLLPGTEEARVGHEDNNHKRGPGRSRFRGWIHLCL